MSVEAITLDGKKIVIASAIGPSSTVNVAAGSTANIDLSVQPNPAIIRNILAIGTVTGLPTGVAINGISYPSLTTIRITVYNPTGAAVSIAANSVTATVLARAT